MKTLDLNFTKIVTIIALIALSSCNRSGDISGKGDGTVARVEFNLQKSEYESTKDLNRAATPYLLEESQSKVSRNTLDIGNGMLLVAKLSEAEPINSPEATQDGSTRDGRRAAIVTEDLAPGIRYRVLVFDDAGAFVLQQEYIRGSEGTAPVMELDGGRTYTFVVYSVNSTAALPGPTFVGGIQTLLTSELTVAGNQDFMYFKRDLTLVGGSTPNRLDIVLKHQFSQITTIIDASQTGYNPMNITASFGPHSTTAIVSLGTGLIARGVQTARSSVTTTFSTGTTTVNYPTIINADVNSLTNYVIASLRIGSLTLTNMTPFTNLTITPGVKYNLLLTITPTDSLLTYAGQPAVRMNGQIWMRHNLGVLTAQDPDLNPPNNTLIGNFYQWGRAAIVANAFTGGGAINGWSDNRNFAITRWNTGTLDAPIKTQYDPCPPSFRVPTSRDQQDLLTYAIVSNVGSFNYAYPITSAKILRSPRNANVLLTFPASGNRYFLDGSSNDRGEGGFYWSSTHPIAERANHFAFTGSNAIVSTSVVSWGMNIRCIAE